MEVLKVGRWVGEKDKPDGQPSIRPQPILLSPPRRQSVYIHQYVRLTQLDLFPAVDERVRRRQLGEVHRDWVHLLLRVEEWLACGARWKN